EICLTTPAICGFGLCSESGAAEIAVVAMRLTRRDWVRMAQTYTPLRARHDDRPRGAQAAGLSMPAARRHPARTTNVESNSHGARNCDPRQKFVLASRQNQPRKLSGCSPES